MRFNVRLYQVLMCTAFTLAACSASSINTNSSSNTTSINRSDSETDEPSLKKYFPQQVGKFKLNTADMSDEESKSMRRSWVSLFGATDFERAIYVNPEAQNLSEAIESAVLLTVASFPSSERANSTVASLANVLVDRGYTIERKKLGKDSGRESEITLGASRDATDQAVIWSRGAIVFQVQAPKRDYALDFAQSFPY